MDWVFLKDAGARIVRPEFRTNHVWEHENLGTFENVDQIIKKVSQSIGAPSNRRLWGIYEDGVIGTDYMVDEQNSEATDRETEAWKRGEQRLWTASVQVRMNFSRLWTPDESSMAKLLKLPRA